MVVAIALVGVDTPVLTAGAMEPETVPFKQLVPATVNYIRKAIYQKKPHTARLNRERSRLCRRSRVIVEYEIETSACRWACLLRQIFHSSRLSHSCHKPGEKLTALQVNGEPVMLEKITKGSPLVTAPG